MKLVRQEKSKQDSDDNKNTISLLMRQKKTYNVISVAIKIISISRHRKDWGFDQYGATEKRHPIGEYMIPPILLVKKRSLQCYWCKNDPSNVISGKK